MNFYPGSKLSISCHLFQLEYSYRSKTQHLSYNHVIEVIFNRQVGRQILKDTWEVRFREFASEV